MRGKEQEHFLLSLELYDATLRHLQSSCNVGTQVELINASQAILKKNRKQKQLEDSDVGLKVRVCMEVPKHVSADTIRSLCRDNNIRMHLKGQKPTILLLINSLNSNLYNVHINRKRKLSFSNDDCILLKRNCTI